jgi:environmental stress-induced protein Ves
MKRIAKSEYKRMPWKNGQGFTDEIEISPAGAKFPADPFLWRLSSASISAPNSFSQFPGCDRWLAIWKGHGLILGDQRLEPGECLRFPGEKNIECSLLGGPVTDIGLIFDRERVDAKMRLEQLTKGPHSFDLSPGVHFFFSLRGGFECEGLMLAEGDTLKIWNKSSVTLNCHENTGLCRVSIDAKSH